MSLCVPATCHHYSQQGTTEASVPVPAQASHNSSRNWRKKMEERKGKKIDLGVGRLTVFSFLAVRTPQTRKMLLCMPLPLHGSLKACCRTWEPQQLVRTPTLLPTVQLMVLDLRRALSQGHAQSSCSTVVMPSLLAILRNLMCSRLSLESSP